jgi:hypothetical protein
MLAVIDPLLLSKEDREKLLDYGILSTYILEETAINKVTEKVLKKPLDKK